MRRIEDFYGGARAVKRRNVHGETRARNIEDTPGRLALRVNMGR
jgi:hypothetical protein